MTNWFAVDKAGLAALTARRDKAFVLAELLSNAWGAPGATRVEGNYRARSTSPSRPKFAL
jgi:hypothetical protein